ncbi:MAG: hypothetical protein PUB18_01300 [bacterium]|nr:hypothetical protein [bacterium]
MEHIIYFGGTFLLVYLIYYFASIRKAKKNTKKIPVEVQYLILAYHIDVKKIPYLSFLNTIAIVGSFDIALVAVIVSLFQDLVWQLLFGFVVVVPIIVISFMLIGKYYQQQQQKFEGETKNKKAKKER